MQDKQKEIITMFDDIAKSYDLTNRIMTCGIDVSWRKKACEIAFSNLSNNNPLCIVDIACGTGDMIIHWKKYAQKYKFSIDKITGLDPSQKMLEIAQKKLPNVSFIQCQATNLPLDNQSVDLISIAYGIRNVLERKKAFEEFLRILKQD